MNLWCKLIRVRRVQIDCINKKRSGFVCAFHPADLGLSPKHTSNIFKVLHLGNCKKVSGWGHGRTQSQGWPRRNVTIYLVTWHHNWSAKAKVITLSKLMLKCDTDDVTSIEIRISFDLIHHVSFQASTTCYEKCRCFLAINLTSFIASTENTQIWW